MQTNRVLMFLAAMTGNWGRRGGGYFYVAAEPDSVLPAASGIEKASISRLAEGRQVVWNDRMIDPPGEAKSDDHWFWIELGKRDPISEQANLKVHLCRVRRVSALGSTSGKV